MRYFSIYLILFNFWVSAAFASNAFLPATSYYVNQEHNYQTQLSTQQASFDGNINLSWSDFKLGVENYVLEYKVHGSNEWQVLYEGPNLYYSNDLPLKTNTYNFRVKCAGYKDCPESGYLYQQTEVVLKPKYVNLAYDNRSQSVNVYWQGLENTEGYVLEQSLDKGSSWQQVVPNEPDTRLYQGQNFSGFVSKSNDVVLTKAASRTLAQRAGIKLDTSLYSTQTINRALNDAAANGSFKYRVKNCNSALCGETKLSNQYNEKPLVGLMPDPTFETGQLQFLPNNAEELTIETARPISGQRSLRASLVNWGYIQYAHKYYRWNNKYTKSGLNGATASGKIVVDYLAQDSRISIYPVAYYREGDSGHRLEGQRLIIKRSPTRADKLILETVRGEIEVDANKPIDFNQQIWLGESQPIMNLQYYVRLLGSAARFRLDNAQLSENGGLGQFDPSFSIYLSNYIGQLKSEWTNFAHNNVALKDEGNTNLPAAQCKALNTGNNKDHYYLVEYIRDSEANSPNANWQTFYCGKGWRHENISAMETGRYRFRLECNGFPNCSQSGYVYGHSIVLREVEDVLAQLNQRDKKVILTWPKTLGAYGYIIQERTSYSGNWQDITPSSIDEQMVWRGDHLFTNNRAVVTPRFYEGRSAQFRIKACRYTRCQDNFGYSNKVYYLNGASDGPVGKVRHFKANKTNIIPGEAIVLSWDRPINNAGTPYQDEMTYNIYVKKPDGAEFLKWSGLTEQSVKREGDTGVQRTGIQKFRIEACNSFGSCGPSVETQVTVNGQTPMPIEFTTANTDINIGDTIALNWKMSANYTQAVRFNVYVNTPTMGVNERLKFRSNLTTTSTERLINKAGVHTFFIEACSDIGGCSERRSLVITVKEPECKIIPKLEAPSSGNVFTWCELEDKRIKTLEVIYAACGDSCKHDAAQLQWKNYGRPLSASKLSGAVTSVGVGLHAVRTRGCTATGECFGWSNIINLNLFEYHKPNAKLKGDIVSWDKIESATRYEMAKFECPSQEKCNAEVLLGWEDIPNIGQATSYKVAQNKEHFMHYRVRACYGSTACSEWSYALEQKTKQVIYIHTDLLGNPVAETIAK